MLGHWQYGRIALLNFPFYHKLFDPQLADTRQLTVDLIADKRGA